MNDKAKGKHVTAKEAASNLFQFLSDTIDDDLDKSEEVVDKEIAATGFDFALAKRKLPGRIETVEKQSVLRAARTRLNAKPAEPHTEGFTGRARALIESEIQSVRKRLDGRVFAYAMRDFSNQPDEDLEAYLEDLKTLEKQADNGSD
jgi:hypothetical protein